MYHVPPAEVEALDQEGAVVGGTESMLEEVDYQTNLR